MSLGQPNMTSYLVAAIAVAIVLFFRVRRMAARRPLKLESLWIIPVVFLALATVTLVQFPPRPSDWPWLTGAVLIGAGLGWQRGRMMEIWVEPENGRLMVQGSRWAIFFLVGLIFIRMIVRSGLNMESHSGALSPGLINDGFVVFAVGLFATQRAEMALRAVRLVGVRASDAVSYQERLTQELD